MVASWGTVAWRATVPERRDAAALDPFREHAHTRRGVERVERCVPEAEGSAITSPSARYLQWRAEFARKTASRPC